MSDVPGQSYRAQPGSISWQKSATLRPEHPQQDPCAELHLLDQLVSEGEQYVFDANAAPDLAQASMSPTVNWHLVAITLSVALLSAVVSAVAHVHKELKLARRLIANALCLRKTVACLYIDWVSIRSTGGYLVGDRDSPLTTTSCVAVGMSLCRPEG
jgi:hypothetical protein